MLSWKRCVSCVTKLSISRRFPVLMLETSVPDRRTRPFCTSQKRIRSFKSVDFPLPLRPTMPTTLPSGKRTETSERMSSPP